MHEMKYGKEKEKKKKWKRTRLSPFTLASPKLSAPGFSLSWLLQVNLCGKSFGTRKDWRKSIKLVSPFKIYLFMEIN